MTKRIDVVNQTEKSNAISSSVAHKTRSPVSQASTIVRHFYRTELDIYSNPEHPSVRTGVVGTICLHLDRKEQVLALGCDLVHPLDFGKGSRQRGFNVAASRALRHHSRYVENPEEYTAKAFELGLLSTGDRHEDGYRTPTKVALPMTAVRPWLAAAAGRGILSGLEYQDICDWLDDRKPNIHPKSLLRLVRLLGFCTFNLEKAMEIPAPSFKKYAKVAFRGWKTKREAVKAAEAFFEPEEEESLPPVPTTPDTAISEGERKE